MHLNDTVYEHIIGFTFVLIKEIHGELPVRPCSSRTTTFATRVTHKGSFVFEDSEMNNERSSSHSISIKGNQGDPTLY